MDHLLMEKKGQVVQITINRPKGLNALNRAILQELSDVFSELRDRGDVRALILTGAGDRAFIAGADIDEMVDLNRQEAEDFSRFGNRIFQQVYDCPLPLIAAIRGYALGGGLELALACDLRIASGSARFAFPETGLGIIPGWGGTQRLARLTSPMTALDLILTGRRIDAEEAWRLGLLSEVTSEEELLPRAWELAETIAKKAPVAVRQAKRAVRDGLDLALEEALELEAVCFGRCFETRDQKRAMRAFLDKEEIPAFEGE